jgi:PAS domain S-box-containing protein
MLGRKLSDVVGERAFRPFQELFERALETGNGESVEYMADLNGGEHWFRMQLAPALEAGGDSRTLCLRISDVTQSRRADEKLHISEAQLARAEQLADLGSWEYDVERQDFTWSQHFFRMLGLEPREGRVSIKEACPSLHPEDRGWLWNDVAKLAATGEPLDNDVRFMRPDGSIRTFHSRAIPIKDASGQVVRIAGMSQNVTEHRQAEKSLHELSRGLLSLRDAERRRMARDLHETAVQSLAALKMGLTRLGDALTDKASLAYALHQSACHLTDDATREVRTVAYLLHPPMLDTAGLESTLRWFGEGFAQRSRIATKVEVPEDFGRLPQEIETTIFRIVQEALTNVHGHSHSRTAAIRLSRDAQAVRCEVEDQGRGMPRPSLSPQAPQARLGVGIAGMQERIQHLKGTFEIRSTPESGTTIRVTIPLP